MVEKRKDMKRINVGIIGLGFISESHVDAVRRIGFCNLYAVADANEALAREKAAVYSVERYYASADALINDKNIDAVHNCTPNFLHTEINKKIICAGKHLLSEKPLSTTYNEAAELVELKKKYPATASAVNFNYRLNPMVQEACCRISDGKIGVPRVITGQYQQDWLLYDTDYSWRLDPVAAGPSCCMADIGSHWMDIVQHVTSHKITEVCADLRTIVPVRRKPQKRTETFTVNAVAEYEFKDMRNYVSIENEDYGAVFFRTDKGASGVFHVSAVAAGRSNYFGFEINGSEASLAWNQEQNDRLWLGGRGGNNNLITRNPSLLSDGVKPYTFLAAGHPEGWNDAFKGNIYAFYKYIADGMKGEPIFSTLEQAAYIVKITEAIIESSKKKKWVKVN